MAERFRDVLNMGGTPEGIEKFMTVVRTFEAKRQIFILREGGEREGWAHLLEGHKAEFEKLGITTKEGLLDAIEKTLREGDVVKSVKHDSSRISDTYKMKYDKGYIKVVITRGRNDIVTAMPET